MNRKVTINLQAVMQTMDILSSKWKIPIVATLFIHSKCRFKDFMEKVEGISGKMLSKELKDLESHGIVQRIVMETAPVVIEYELTLYGETLKPILKEFSIWGNSYLNKLDHKKSPIGHFNTIDI